MASGKFATSISCMDGRIQIPITHWVKSNYPVDYVDTITEPGIDKKVSDDAQVEQIKAKVDISINVHKSNMIVVSGHHDCAGNPVSKKEHITQISQWVKKIKSWNLDVPVVGLWVNEDWHIEQV